MNEYVGKLCPYCKAEIKDGDEVTVCPECGIPHHADCWKENGGCTTFGCKAQHYEEQHAAPADVCANCGAPLSEGQIFCPKCGHKTELPLDTDVSSAISQFNAEVSKANAAKKKKPIKAAGIAAAVIVIVILAIFLAPKLFKSADDYMAEGNYEKAYSVAKTDEKDDVIAENTVAFCSSMATDRLKDPASFELRSAWYQDGDVVLLVAGSNSYGNIVTNHWYYSYDEDDQEWELVATYTELAEEKYSMWDSVNERYKKLIKNLSLSSTVIPMTSDDSLKLSSDGIDRINALFASGLLDDVVLIES